MSSYKTIRFKGTPEEVNSQWLEARKNGIGGSDAAAVVGQNDYATPYTVWLEKTGRIDPPDLSDKESVYWGAVLEDVVAKEFAKRHPEYKVKRINALLQSKDHPFMQASLDRIITDENGNKGVLEIKTAGERRKADWGDEVPDYYLPQVTHYLAVTGFSFFAVAVLIGGQSYKEYICQRDEEDVDCLIQEEQKFWGYVTMDDMPPVRGGQAEANALLEMSPQEDNEYVEVLDQDFPQVQELHSVNEQIKVLEDHRSELANAIKQKIGNHKGIKTPTWLITWPRSESSRFDSKRFRAENPEAYDKYLTTSTRDGGLRFKEAS